MHQYSSRLFCSGEPVKAMRLLVAEKVRERRGKERGGRGEGMNGKKMNKNERKEKISQLTERRYVVTFYLSFSLLHYHLCTAYAYLYC